MGSDYGWMVPIEIMMGSLDHGKVPPLHITETTEVRWRNLICWEQSRICIRYKYISYALFFQGLICCKHDIGWLEKKGVIVNESNMNKEELLTMFLTISKGAEHMDSSYTEICLSLNEYKPKGVKEVFSGFTTTTWHHYRRVLEAIKLCWRN